MTNCICTECQDHRPCYSLEEWREVMCINPYYFWQMQQNPANYQDTIIPGRFERTRNCDPLIYQHCHCDCGDATREDIWNSLARADEAIKDFTHTWPCPTYQAEEVSDYQANRWRGNSWQRSHHSWWVACTRMPRLRLKCNQLTALGPMVLTELETVPLLNADITDENNDLLFDTVTLTINNPGIPADEVHLFFHTDDWINDNRWKHEIRPLEVVDNGATFTVTFPSWLAVNPQNYDTIDCIYLDPQDLDIYADQLVVYQMTNDPTQAVRVCHTEKCPCVDNEECWESDFYEACILSSQKSFIELEDQTLDLCKCIEPERLKFCVNYQAGGCAPDYIVSRLATAFLPGMARECCKENERIAYYRTDFITLDSRGRPQNPLSDAESGNPFGTRIGHVDAWRYLKALAKNNRKVGRI